MPLVDIKELAKIAANARALAAKVLERRKREDEAKQRRANAAIKARVEEVLANVESICMKAAEKGENHAIVYSIPHSEYATTN